MQFRELGKSELDDALSILQSLYPDLTPERFANFINANTPHTYRPLGAFERGHLAVYAGVSLSENLDLGRYLVIDDFIALDEYANHASQMIDYLCDFGKMHGCTTILFTGKYRGITIEDLHAFRPKRGVYIKTV